MKMICEYIEYIPVHAFIYMQNGDRDGLTDEEIKQIEDFQAEYQRIADHNKGTYTISANNNEKHFRVNPSFGKGGDCYRISAGNTAVHRLWAPYGFNDHGDP